MAFFPLWTYAHPKAIELAEKMASLAPGDLNRVFFTTGGAEAVESAWKLARQYHKMRGDTDRYKVISRDIAYHGTTLGALTITSLQPYRKPFEPLVPGAVKVPEHQLLPRRPSTPTTSRPSALWRPTRSKRRSCARAPRPSPRSSSSPCRTPAAASRRRRATGERVREICDRYGVLLVSDEVICAFGRLGTWFGGQQVRLRPRHHHLRQGHHLGLRAAGRDDRLGPHRRALPARRQHPSCTASPSPATRSRCAVALKNIEIIERRATSSSHVLAQRSDYFRAAPRRPRATCRSSATCAATGYFWGIELVKDQETKETFGRRGRRAAPARLPLARDVPTRPDLPLRRPW